MKKFFSGLALLTAMCLLGSCEDDIFGWGSGARRTYGENEIVLSFGGSAKSAKTRSDVMHTVVAPSNVIDLPCEEDEEDGGRFCLMETVTSMDENFYDAISATRGTPVYTENFDYLYSNELGVTAFQTASTQSSLNEQEGKEYAIPADIWGGKDFQAVNFSKVKDEAHTYSYNYSSGETNLPWPSNDKLQLFIEAPLSVTNNTAILTSKDYTEEGWINFYYKSPLTSNVGTPEAQKDILFSSKVITKAQNDAVNAGDAQPHKILLYHALSGVKFKVSQDAIDEGTTITFNSIEFLNLYSEGLCTIKPNYEDNVNTSGGNPSNAAGVDATKSSSCATWMGQKEPKVFKLTLTDDDNTTSYADRADGLEFPKSFTKQTEGATGTVADYNLNDDEYSKTFLFVPQTISPDGAPTRVRIRYTVTDVNGTHTYTANIVMPQTEWKAGELRTYTIGRLYVHVDIDDEMNAAGEVKTGLTTTNTGTAPEYQRVVITANWMYDEPDHGPVIVKPYSVVTMKADGTVMVDKTGFADFPGTDWALGSDGFFYYKYPIKAGYAPNTPLFSSFSAAGIESPYPGAHLEMQISVQAVKFEAEKTTLNAYWGSGSASSVKDPVVMTLPTETKGAATKTGTKVYGGFLLTTVETPTTE